MHSLSDHLWGWLEDAFVFAISNLPSAPVLGYSTYLGGSATDAPPSIAVDAAGDVVLVGSTTSTDFPDTPPSATTPRIFNLLKLMQAENLQPPSCYRIQFPLDRKMDS